MGPGPGCGPRVLAGPDRGQCPARRPGGYELRCRRAKPRPGGQPRYRASMSSSHSRSRSGCSRHGVEHQLADELAVTAQRQVGFGPGLDDQGQLGEMRSLGVGEAGVRELGERLPPSQPQRFAQRGRGERYLPLLKQAPSFATSCSKRAASRSSGTDVEGITGVGGEDRRGAEGTTQLTDLGLQGVDRVGHLPVTPQRVDQQVCADRLSPMKRQEGQDRSLLGARTGTGTPPATTSNSPKNFTSTHPPYDHRPRPAPEQPPTALRSGLSATGSPTSGPRRTLFQNPRASRVR